MVKHMEYDFKSIDLDMLYNHGYSIKFWICENNKEYLIKLDTPLKESEKEYSASKLAKAFGIDSVDYEKIDVTLDNNLYRAVKSESYLKLYDEELTLYEVLGCLPEDKLTDSEMFNFIVNRASDKTELDKEYLREKLIEMITFDYLICNIDRHLNNIILIRNADEYRFSPLFDFGRAFAGTDSIKDTDKILDKLREAYLMNKSFIKDIQDIDLDYSKALVKKWLTNCGGLEGLDNLDICLGHKLFIKYRINQLLSL